MTNKQTIDGVPRARLTYWAECLESAGFKDIPSEMRALLDKPAYPNRLCHDDYSAHPYICGCLKGDAEAQRRFDEHHAKAAQPQGEPVARQPDAIIEGVMTSVGITHAIYASTVSLKHGEQVKLYAEQPAPVAVVLPERLELPTRDEFESADYYAAALGEANKWNECLDEVAQLNGLKL